MPVVCVAAGGVLGVLAAATLPRLRSPGEWARSAAGALVGATSLLACRCTTLLLGETLGLLAGLLATSAGVAAARARWGGRAAAR